VLVKDNLSKWVKGKPLRDKIIIAVARFLWEDIIYKFSLYGRLVINGGKENKGIIK
jgi:hypothetical protein